MHYSWLVTCAGGMYQLSQFGGDLKDGDPEHDAILHSRGQRSDPGKMGGAW